MIYLDQAATSNPKPQPVYDAMLHALHDCNANPGRGAHRQAIAASRLVFDARETIASYFGLEDSSKVIFTANATAALNLGIHGLAKPDSTVVISSFEHNSVYRPAAYLAKTAGIDLEIIPPGGGMPLDLNYLEQVLQKKSVSLLALTHASNVSGQILPIEQAGELAKRASVPFLLDASQTAGHLPIDLSRLPVDFMACSGHKGLLGPQGTGVFCINHEEDGTDAYALRPLVQGGTGGNSDSSELPNELPDRFESGTVNTPGIAGLAAAVTWLQTQPDRREKEQQLCRTLLNGLAQISGVHLLAEDAQPRIGVVSFFVDEIDSGYLASKLDQKFGILCRAGLHCAPLAHQVSHSYPHGTVRFSLSGDNLESEVVMAIEAVRQCCS